MKVAELWRYPVKSLQGEAVDRLEFGARGAVGDRQWAFVSNETGKLLSAKTIPQMLVGRARLVDGVAEISHPGESVAAWLERDVRLAEVADDTAVSYEMTFDPPNDDAELYEIPAPPATFQDLAAVHVLTTASLARCHDARPDLQWDRRRFRPTILIDSDEDGFPEQAWVGHQVRIGSVVINVDLETVRCALPLRAQPALGENALIERSTDIYRTLDEIHYNHLGVYCSVNEPGVASVGDEVVVID